MGELGICANTKIFSYWRRNYGTISNHLAHHLFEYLVAHNLLGDKLFYYKAIDILDTIEANTDDEGWHLEYRGGDPGYQTRTLKYLVKSLPFLAKDEHMRCMQLCEKSCSFLSKAILPDGTIFSAFGSRNTSIIYPSGIEFMAQKNEKFIEIANRVRISFEANANTFPEYLEFDNYIRLFDDLLEAEEIKKINGTFNSNFAKSEPASDFHLKNFGLLKKQSGAIVYMSRRNMAVHM